MTWILLLHKTGALGGSPTSTSFIIDKFDTSRSGSGSNVMDAPPSVFRTQLLGTRGLEPSHTGTRFFSPQLYFSPQLCHPISWPMPSQDSCSGLAFAWMLGVKKYAPQKSPQTQCLHNCTNDIVDSSPQRLCSIGSQWSKTILPLGRTRNPSCSW